VGEEVERPRHEDLDVVKRTREVLGRCNDDPEVEEVVEELIASTGRFQKLWLEGIDIERSLVEPWRKEVNRLRALILPDASQVDRMTEALTLHHKVRVAPITDYCQAFFDWHKAIADALQDPEVSDMHKDSLRPIKEALDALYIPVMKSNYLARRIYGGEEHRTEKCPVHNGHWSGMYWPGTPDADCPCADTGTTTGWISKDNPFDPPASELEFEVRYDQERKRVVARVVHAPTGLSASAEDHIEMHARYKAIERLRGALGNARESGGVEGGDGD
jgi:hypothetical protein